MSWFESGNGDDVIGDLPADAVRRALDEIALMGVQQRGRAPTVRELLAAIAAALGRTLERGDVSPGYQGPSRLVARFEGGVHQSQAEAADQDTTDRLLEAFEEAAQRYSEDMGREPRVSELLETVTFVLGADPPRYVSDPDAGGLELEGLDQER